MPGQRAAARKWTSRLSTFFFFVFIHSLTSVNKEQVGVHETKGFLSLSLYVGQNCGLFYINDSRRSSTPLLLGSQPFFFSFFLCRSGFRSDDPAVIKYARSKSCRYLIQMNLCFFLFQNNLLFPKRHNFRLGTKKMLSVADRIKAITRVA